MPSIGHLFSVVLLLTSLADGAVTASRRPNVILVLSDDVGLSRIGCYGGAPFQTPNLDKLASEGMRFERCYSMPLCGPSRGVLLTGKYPFRTGYLGNSSSVIDPAKHPTLPNVLRGAGYATCAIGKLGQSAPENDAQAPRALGFDEHMLWMGRNTPDRYWNPRYCRNGEFVQGRPDQYGPDVTHAFLADFMRRHREKPFFVYYSAVLAHTPFMPTPDSAPNTKDKTRMLQDMVGYLDKQMGALVAELDRLGLRENTIVIFTSDNGPFGDPLGTVRGKPLHGSKGDVTEGGVREPLIVNCPARVPAGRVCPDLTDFSDLFPTVLELTGTPAPDGLPLDGRSVAPQILGRPGRPRDWVYAQLAGEWFVADARHKLYGDGKFTDITDSPAEERTPKPDDVEAQAAKVRLAEVLARLRPGAVSTGPRKPAPKAPVTLSPYQQDLRLLAENGIITGTAAWEGKAAVDGALVAEALMKAARRFAPASTHEQAIAVLQRQGVISTPGYWQQNAVQGKTCAAASTSRLVEKLAFKLRER
jgi:arylsulfatase A